MHTTSPAGAYHLAAGEGEPMSWFTAAFQLKASDRQLGAMELTAAPGVEPPMHVHRHEDEYYYLLDGEVTFHVGGENHSGRAGSFMFLPRSVPHTFTIESPSARMLLLNAPGGFERMFELAPSTPEEAIAALARYDVAVVGPHPREAGDQAPPAVTA
jgi:quercetin dioxygenase-like cupin family protein